ncbi:nuclear transport factor 2 family protein [Flavobacterium pectinovorum]|uniref:Nuclear transport factor 2 family protein n=1 Tax=Flavobacterium pectinovorum TaxID=29533 RepID=A0A502EX32_9FLAO|nr:nuclear transport factor 2 family protein [Flavobacterium pectinovorum]TPG41594.1 nuclear transport factor 2 family protein [Flavobacterium pectinovorum]
MRKLITIAVAVFMFISCNNQNQPKIEDTAQNEKLVKQYFDHFNNHDWKKMSEMYIETADFKDPSFGKGIVKQTRKQTEDKYAELNKIFPDLHDKIIQIYPSGEKNIIVEFVSTGTAPDNSKLELPICTVFTIENGLITKDFTYFDNFEADTSKK